MRVFCRSAAGVVACAVVGAADPASAQPDPSGIEFITVGAPGNAAYAGPDINNVVTGRGSVAYEYRLGQTEVTSGQWLEFYNAFWGREPGLTLPVRWGGSATGNPSQPFRLTSPSSGMWPAGGMSWRTCAMFVNWLNNDKSTDVSAAMSGAYDATTFGYDEGGRFTDQREHTPGARYWIPTFDEWIKGAYYDQNYGGAGVGGWWWNNTNGTNIDPIYGPPGLGQGNAGFNLPNEGHFRIPLMAYLEVRSPWGMLDASGATSEMFESVDVVDTVPYRRFMGSAWDRLGPTGDRIYSPGSLRPTSPDYHLGLRIASAVPSPGIVMVLGVGLVAGCGGRGRGRGREDEPGADHELCGTVPRPDRYTHPARSNAMRAPKSDPLRGLGVSMRVFCRFAAGVVACAVVGAADPASAQPDPSGIEFITVGAPGNAAYAGPDINNVVTGRGSVSYEYRLGQTEVTSGQWLEFYNAFWGRVPGLTLPVRWGGSATGNPAHPFRLSTPDSGMWPAGGMSWRTAAMFVNWLNNDKSHELSAVMNGAYDATTFGYDENGRFTDQEVHTSGARYWIPTIDEWIKGAYYDPNYGGTGVAGWWWNNTNGTNAHPVYGPPGMGQGNAAFNLPNEGHFRIPLMAYPDTRSPWGMLDVSGATREMFESVRVVGSIGYRRVLGSSWDMLGTNSDGIYSTGAILPSHQNYHYGLRISSAVPSPGMVMVLGVGLVAGCGGRGRRRG